MSFYMKGITMFYLDNQVNLPWWAIALIVFASILIVLAIIALIISKVRHQEQSLFRFCREVHQEPCPEM